jgi:Fe-Mn family superoxide dismutase
MHQLTRRQLLQLAGTGAAALSLAPLTVFAEQDKGKGFELPKLPYDYAALEPDIDAETMKIHHDRHHKAYVDNLNTALENHADLQKKELRDLLRESDKLPDAIKQSVINNAGGHANHTLFWNVMTPDKKSREVPAALTKAIDMAFESVDKLKAKMTDAALKRFGSGWAWLVADDKGKLDVYSTANQDSPYMKNHTPLLGLDVWEHAYYLKYQNKRADYVKAWWNVVNWKHVGELHAKVGKG